ncbi:MAG: RhuM family protein [Algoriphagus aquaeductus]|uniref:RhuM family protein n=1 Tax=Algoriphagus aquaeductus TaxID=475299 RepID=UPI00387A5D48
MEMPDFTTNELVIFKSSQAGTEFEIILDGEHDTVWVTEQQLMDLYGKARRTIGEHIRNIYKEGELDQNSTWRKFRQVQKEGEREVSRTISVFNLEVVISVGYRVKSPMGVEFRRWATQRLKDYLIKGYAVNQQRLSQLQQSFKLIREAALSEDFSKSQVREIIDILSDYAMGLDILDGYDKQNLELGKVDRNPVFQISYSEAKSAIEELRIKFGGSPLFGREKDNSFQSSISTINQTFDGKELYPSIEEKAAHLLYFVVKNHSFTDGNKRIAAWLFVWYLAKNNYLLDAKGNPKVANNALAAITLMVALSKPEEKDLMILVIVNSINKGN